MVFTTLAMLLYGPLVHAQSRPAAGDSTHRVGVARLVQVLNAVQADELRTLKIEDFLAQRTGGGGELKSYVKDGQLVKMVGWVGVSSCGSITV